MERLRIFIKGLPPNKNEENVVKHIKDLMGYDLSHGGIREVKVICKVSTGKSRRIGFIGCKNVEVRDLIIAALNGTFWENSKLELSVAMASSEMDLMKCSSEISRKKAERMKKGMTPAVLSKDKKRRELKSSEISEANQTLMGKTTRVLIENLPYEITEVECREYFLKFGEFHEMKYLKDELTDTFQGKIIINFKELDGAIKCVTHIDNDHPNKICDCLGRGIWIQLIEAPRKFDEEGIEPVAGASSAYKRQLKKKEKANAENSKLWNLLYVSSHSAVDKMAKRLGVSADDIMSLASGDSIAGRAALAESQIVRETQKWLVQNGVMAEAFVRKGSSLSQATNFTNDVPRSSDTLIVKHLPPGVTEESLQSQFQEFGTLSRVLLSPSMTVAIVQYMDDSAARRALQNLVMTPVKIPGKRNIIPLYLEWAPESTFTTTEKTPIIDELIEFVESTAPDDGSLVDTESNPNLINDDDNKETSDKSLVVPTKSTANTTEESSWNIGENYLYVGNLSFNSKEEDLKALFSKNVGFQDFKLPTRTRTKRDGTVEILIQGYGFAYFDNEKNLKKALKSMNGITLDGHSLTVQLPKGKKTETKLTAAPSEKVLKYKDIEISSKLIIKNLAFQCTVADVKKIFASAGEVKSVRLPVNHDGRIKGYGFVEMASKAEALAAVDQLGNVHLYGRRINIDFSKTEDRSVESQMTKSKKKRLADFHSSMNHGRKRLKTNMEEEED